MSESLGSTVKAISHLAKAASKATEAWLGYTLGGHSLQSPQNNLLIKKTYRLPTPDRCERRLFPPEQKRVQAIPMPIQFA